MSTLEWMNMTSAGEAPIPAQSSTMSYYNGNILMTAGDPGSGVTFRPYLYSYSLKNQSWEVVSDKSSYVDCRYFTTSFVYNEEFYLVFGWLKVAYADTTQILKINLTEKDSNWTVVLDNPLLARDSHSSTLINNTLYIFGGYCTSTGLNSNKLFTINLETLQDTEINDDCVIPDPRYAHSMHLINSLLYIFGGQNSDTFYNEVWSFNPATSQWSSISTSGAVPSGRIHHAAGSEGDALVIWGGEDASGLQNDMYIFNVLTQTWTQIVPVSLSNPIAGKGACLVFSSPKIYLYGGIVSNGISNLLWSYDLGTNSFTLLSDGGLLATSYSTCYLQDGMILVAFGSMSSDQPNSEIFYYDLDANQWGVYHFHTESDYDSAQSIQLFINGQLIRIGGEAWMLSPSNWIDISGPGSQYNLLNSTTSIYLYDTGFIYFNKSIYVFGGGSTIGMNLRSSIAHNLMLQIPLEDICIYTNCSAPCSAGTFEVNGVCQLCQTGEYAEGYGNTECIPCGPGTYSGDIGATFNKQCLPCPVSTFNPRYGASMCLDCPEIYNCPVGSKTPTFSVNGLASASVQPPMYVEPDTATTTLDFELGVGLGLGLLLLGVLLMKRTREKLEVADVFKDKHNTKLNEFMVLKQTKVGGAFTFVFLILMVILVGSTCVSYFQGNIKETKALVPLVVLESEVKDFQAAYMSLVIEFDLYGGLCVVNSSCVPELQVTPKNIICDKVFTTCQFTSIHSCVITSVCTNGQIRPGAYISIELTEKLSYASAIRVNLTSSSSVPQEISSVYTAIWPDTENVFIGSVPSQFYFTATPSLFTSESSLWSSSATGYHISSETATMIGSQFKPSDLSTVSYLGVNVQIVTSNSALLTTRYLKQNAVYFISSLLGSVFGLLSMVGGVMKAFETQLNKLHDWKAKKSKSIDILYAKRKKIAKEIKETQAYRKSLDSETCEALRLKE